MIKNFRDYLNKPLFLIFVVFIFLISAGCSQKSENQPTGPAEPADWKQIKKDNFPGKTSIEINPLIELDGKTKKEVYEIRAGYVNKHPELVKVLYRKDYKPSDEVFGQITDGKTWWGILGLFYYGRGEKSIEGPSEETRFLANPYLLIGLGENVFRQVKDQTLEPKAFYAVPDNLIWDLKNSQVTVNYNLHDFLNNGKLYGYCALREFLLVSYNARDLGFPFAYIDPDQTKGIVFVKSDIPISIPHFIHTGGSSGYPGGSNNMSPDCPPLNITMESLPAKAVVKLWRSKPDSVKSEPDLWYVMTFEDTPAK
ncbi:MAG: hypothetical protein LWY06_12055 [Firmicutes bacterium]|nr:hypothetical protein [Bacillota bacterium]